MLDYPCISIIIPVYNAEKTIKKCVESILSQTFNDWELILVDDGSTDSSGYICDYYSHKYACGKSGGGIIRVIHKSNGGVSSARQQGLDSAVGEYVIHADADDWVENNMLECLYKKAEDEGADMVICDFWTDNKGVSFYRRQKPTSLESNDVLSDLFGVGVHGSCCNKMVRRSCIERCKASFPIGVDYCEDVCFNVQLLRNNIKISYLDKAFYHYVQDDTSITRQYTVKTLESQINYIKFLSTIFPSDSDYIIQPKELVKKMAFRSGLLKKRTFMSLFPEVCRSHDKNVLSRIMYSLAFSGYYFSARLLLIFYNFLQRLKL